MKRFFLFFIIVCVFACSPKHEPLPGDHFIPGLAMPLHLDKDTSLIYLSDLVPDMNSIDSVYIDGQKISLPANMEILYQVPRDAKPMMEMKLWRDGNYQSAVLMKNREVDFLYSFNPGKNEYHTVQLAGEFNGWTPSRTTLALENGKWTTLIPLNPGRYQYQVVLDGHWQTDPSNPDSIDNNVGGFNSVLKAGMTDKAALPFLFTDEYDEKENEFSVKWTHKPDEFFVFWQNIRLDDYYLEVEEDELGVRIPEEAEGMERSYIRVYSYNEKGISNMLLLPLEKRKVVLNPGQLKRTDK